MTRTILGILSCQQLRISPEEVGAEGTAYAHEHLGVDARLAEDVIHVGTLAIDFAGEPGRSPLLAAQFLFYESAYVYHEKWTGLIVPTHFRRHRQAPGLQVHTSNSAHIHGLNSWAYSRNHCKFGGFTKVRIRAWKL